MSNRVDPLSSFSSPKARSPLLLIVCFVIAFHGLLLELGTFWHPAQPPPKARSKVIVQTVRLQSVQAELEQPSSLLAASPTFLPPSLSIEPPQPLLPPPEPIKEAPPLLKPEIINQKEEILPIQETTSPPSPSPVSELSLSSPAPPTPLPIKTEKKPQPKAIPKPALQDPQKKSIKQAAPVKKSSEAPKKEEKKSEAIKPKQAEEEKKRQQELAEKKKQQEKADAENKRQQEIAAAQEAAKQKERALLAKAKENLAKMNQTRDKISTPSSVKLDSTAIPKELASLHVDALPLEGAGEWGIKETSYSDEVAYLLKMSLKLPDYGAVKIKLTLDRTGKVIKVEILQSESHKNKTYVESKIPALSFPSFGQKFQGMSQNTFVITLQNEA